jgi:homoserine O-acetyltransferase
MNLKLSLLLLCFLSAAVQASYVEKKVFTTEDFEFFNGERIAEVKVGWQSYGKLNEAKDNAILITHFFSGNSHVAGRYEEGGALGYWDAIVGPGKAIDTDRYFVISVDTLVNQEPFNPMVTTTGPASTNPETGKPYALDFPVTTIRDFVNVQKALLDELDIERLHAVVGASMGSLQAIDWAAAYPERVERMVSVIGMAQADPWTVLSLQQWAEPILSDPDWQGGDYYQGDKPLDGVRQTLMQISLQAMHPNAINATFGGHETLNSEALHDIEAVHGAVSWLRQRARERAEYADANHLLYLVRANQLFIAGMQDDLETGLNAIQARTLFMPASNDLLLRPALARKAHDILLEQGKDSSYVEIDGNWGHLDGILSIESQADTLREFINH